MKSRLEPAPLTDEDYAIWARLWVVAGDGIAFARLVHHTGAADFLYDRRDVDLMWLAERFRDGQFVMGHTYAWSSPRSRFAINAIRCGGNLPRMSVST